ncbi:hypothetical protein ACQVTX_02700 [Bacillus pretiosus]
MNEKGIALMERKKPTILDNPPSDETALKMAEFFYENFGTSYIGCS